MMQNDIFTVTQINRYISAMFNDNRTLCRVKLKGEISNCKYHSSGHIYFTLKDDNSQIAAVMWRSSVQNLKVWLAEGMQVVASGRIALYEKGGSYQLYADDISPDGGGALYELYEKLKVKLTAEGLFDLAHKKPIPEFAKTVGIVTASTGAAVHDMISVSKRRNPYIKLILYPAKVQGKGAAESVIRGIKKLEKLKPDVIIIGRGGGSFEDLFEFNDEALARTIYECEIPIISAVGHETDVTISDFAADLRAPTPSAAAELAVCEIDSVLGALVDLHADILSAMQDKLEKERDKTEKLRLKLKSASPAEMLKRRKDGLLHLEELLKRNMKNRVMAEKARFFANLKAMDALSPLKRLEAGYAYATDENGHNIRSVTQVKPDDAINIRLTDGSLLALVKDINGKDTEE